MPFTYAIAQSTVEGLDVLTSEFVEADGLVELEHVVLCAINDSADLRIGLRLDSERDFDHVDDLVLEIPWGDSAPIGYYGTTQYETFSGTFTLATDNATTARDLIDALRALWRSRSTLSYRDERGRRFFAKITSFKEKDRRVQFYTVQLGLTEVGHVEGVA
jgi:hypothetical protein